MFQRRNKVETELSDMVQPENIPVWWKEVIVYQIYPRSFQDSNEDGTGDLRGIISRLDNVKSLGVNVIRTCKLRLILDLRVDPTTDEHLWFGETCISPWSTYYHWWLTY